MTEPKIVSSPLLRTPLFELIQQQKARFTPFSGWEMPVQYQGLKQEHQAVRTDVGMFDISHMGKFALSGQNLISQLQTLVPSDLSRLKPGEAQYTVLLNSQAGIIDDIIFYHQGEDKGFLIVNAGTTAKDKAWLLENLPNLQLTDYSGDRILLAIQGVKAVSILQSLVEGDLNSMKAFNHKQMSIYDRPAFIARTGYTGEDGFEVMVEPEIGQKLWQDLLNLGVTPCGLGARDTLRLEAALSLYGQDIDETTTPLEAGLGWLVHLDKSGDFMGREVLEQQKKEGVSKRLVGLEMSGRHIARHGYPVLAENKVVGEVTSGTFAPTLVKAIALAYVSKPLSKIGQKLEVEIRGKNYPALVVKKPFYRSKNK